MRKTLSPERPALTHKFTLAGYEGYIIVGLFPDGTPGEVFINMAKEGSTIRGLMDSIGILTSLALQYGVPLTKIADKFRFARFEPQGFAQGCDEIETASSVLDYVFHWLVLRFTDKEDLPEHLAEWSPEPDMSERK